MSPIDTVKVKLEIQIEDDHVKQVHSLGGVAIKGEFPGRTGWPDRLVLMPNSKFYWIEFKRPNNSLQDDQIEMIRLLKDRGHTVHLCDSFEYSNKLIARYFK